MEQALSRVPLDLDYLEFVCSQELVFLSAISRAGPRHKRTKRLLRAPVAGRGPQEHIKLQFNFKIMLMIIIKMCNKLNIMLIGW